MIIIPIRFVLEFTFHERIILDCNYFVYGSVLILIVSINKFSSKLVENKGFPQIHKCLWCKLSHKWYLNIKTTLDDQSCGINLSSGINTYTYS